MIRCFYSIYLDKN